MEGSGAPRAYLVTAAAMFLCLVVVLIATTRASGAGDQAGASKAASQLSKLKKQVASLQAQIDQVSKQPGPPGPPGPQGPPGTLSGTISGGPGGQLLDNTVDNADLAPNAEFSGTAVPGGGDLAGFYPTPTLATNTVQDSEIASDAVGFDELKPSSVGSLEVNDGALAIQDVAEDNGVFDVPNGSLPNGGILQDSCATMNNIPAAADVNDIMVATPSADVVVPTVFVTARVDTGGAQFDLAVCNPTTTMISAPDFVHWAVLEVP